VPLPAPALFTGSTLPVLGGAAVTTVACVVLHFTVIRLIVRVLVAERLSPKVAINGTVLALLLTHLVEIVLFAVCHELMLAAWGPGIGDLTGDYNGTLTDKVYFSTAVYTTVGFGDITPHGPIRLFVGVEALAGLVLITWSASFTFLVMQRVFERAAAERGANAT